MVAQTGPLQFKRGTTAKINAYTAAVAEPVYNTDNNSLSVGGIAVNNVTSVMQYGAIANGSSHPLSTRFATLALAQVVYPHATALSDEIDWCAVQAALNNNQVVYVPKGVYVLNRQLSKSNRHINIFGDGVQSELRFTAQVKYGLRITQNSGFETDISNLFISTNLLNNGKGLSISYAGFVGEYERNKRFANVIGNRVSGVDYFQHGWKTCFEFDEVTLPLIENNFAVGRRLLGATGEAQWWPWTDYGFYYTSSTNLSPTDVLFNSNDCRYARTAYQNLGVLEGVRYNDCLAVACKYGIIDDRREVSGPITIDPWLMVTGCHLNVSAVGVQTYYGYQGWIEDNLIYQFTFVDEAFVGISTQTGNNWKIKDNHITGNSSSAFTVKGIRVQQNNKSLICFNEIEGVDIPIECSGTDGIVDTRFFMNRGINKAGVEARTVTYINGADPFDNPSATHSGVVSEGFNAAVVPIASGSFATMSLFSLDKYPQGSAFRITAICQITKGSTAGTTKLYVEKTAGTASNVYMANATGLGVQNDLHAAGSNWQASLVGIIKKTTDGTLQLKLAVSSGGSNASVASGDSQYILERIA